MLYYVIMGERRSPEIEEDASPAHAKPVRAPWGVGRMALFARLDAITADLAAGRPMTTIYKRHMAGRDISYSGFRKLVRRHSKDAGPARRHSATPPSDTSPAAPHRSVGLAPATSLPATPQDGPPSHAAGEQPRATFRYSPIAKEGEIDRLFGSGFFCRKEINRCARRISFCKAREGSARVRRQPHRPI